MREFDVDIGAIIDAASNTGSSWRERAACRGMATEAFFAEVPGADVRQACARCPVRLPCLADEVGQPAEEICGFRAAMPESARRRLLARVARHLPVEVRPEVAAAQRAFKTGAPPSAVASRFGVSVRTAYRWRSNPQRRAG